MYKPLATSYRLVSHLKRDKKLLSKQRADKQRLMQWLPERHAQLHTGLCDTVVFLLFLMIRATDIGLSYNQIAYDMYTCIFMVAMATRTQYSRVFMPR